jgi:hypothetical protein
MKNGEWVWYVKMQMNSYPKYYWFILHFQTCQSVGNWKLLVADDPLNATGSIGGLPKARIDSNWDLCCRTKIGGTESRIQKALESSVLVGLACFAACGVIVTWLLEWLSPKKTNNGYVRLLNRETSLPRLPSPKILKTEFWILPT